ncbi:MAG: DUF5752 family protein [Nitrospira sp.]|jgi:hypothetical protein|nr:DUF5752 family protein [Nitrospira sp.]MDH4242122.1 DUF5752 family protein [Nitrospira sp.]MDH4354762.1 DUF5752 family protein [Nitrospira sp.]MDH5316757.1 DUF5752 family protein [Nitrospira sp.]
MTTTSSDGAFRFLGCSEIQEILGKQAEDERTLAELLEEVPLDSIYFHTHSFFLRHRFIERTYPNDFAEWVGEQVRDHVLAERLSVVDPFEYPSLEALREELISLIDDHLSGLATVPRAGFGAPFYFNRSRILEVPTGLEARTLREFRAAISEVDVSVIYFHVFESHLRLQREENDFSAWIRHGLRLTELADRMKALNPYLGSLERLRSSLLNMCDDQLARGG